MKRSLVYQYAGFNALDFDVNIVGMKGYKNYLVDVKLSIQHFNNDGLRLPIKLY